MSRDDPTVLGMLRDKGRPIHLLEKPHDAGEDPWCHKYHPHALETYRRLVGRKPARPGSLSLRLTRAPG